MKTSESISNISKALVRVQTTIGAAVKFAQNPFFNSKFVDLTTVIKAIKEPLNRNGVAFLQFPITSEGGRGIGVETVLLHESGEWISKDFVMPLEKATAQGAGSCLSYARRYSLVSVLGLPQVDDDAEAAMFRSDPIDQSMNQDVATKDELCAAAVEKHQEALDYIRGCLAKSVGKPDDNWRAEAIEAFHTIPEADQLALWVAPSTTPSAFFTTLERKQIKRLDQEQES